MQTIPLNHWYIFQNAVKNIILSNKINSSGPNFTCRVTFHLKFSHDIHFLHFNIKLSHNKQVI